MSDPKMVRGDLLNLPFPTSPESLLEQGEIWLTDAMRGSGTITPDNAVTAIERSSEFFGGGMGRKLLLSVNYREPDISLPTELFIKFPRDFGDPLRPLFAPLMSSEARFALLSRREDFPTRVPRCLFAEYHRQTTSGILISERIAYGNDGIEPAYEKCMDYQLPDPLAHYRALARAMARLAGHHKSGRLGPGVDEQFPLEPEMVAPGCRIPFGAPELASKLAGLEAFAEAVPHLFPDGLGSRAFLSEFAKDAAFVLENEAAITAFLNNQSDLVALCHLNTNVDNAWFWRNPLGDLEVGLLDWGGVGQMSVATGFYGLTCSAETDFLNAHRREMMSLVVAEYAASGGPAVALDDFALATRLASAVMGIAWMLDAPALVQTCIPDYRTLSSRFDPRLQGNFLARVQLQPLVVLLNEWREERYGEAVRWAVGNGAGSLAGNDKHRP